MSRSLSLRNVGWLLLAIGASACAADEREDSESLATTSQAVVGQQTFLYFQCNATGWVTNASTRLVPSSTSGTWTITYDVTQPWMTTGSDTCSLVETNQLDGWGTQRTFYDKSGAQLLTVPAAAPGTGQYVAAQPSQDYRFNVKYPALGKYRMNVNWQSKTFSIERVTAAPTGWRWPLAGQDGTDWVINNYVDLDPSSAIRDYRGGLKAYDNHLGTDIDIPSFREMDLGRPVLAASAGRVTQVGDGNSDRNLACQGEWNFVKVLTDDGYEVSYGHLRKNSVAVSVGGRVDAGATLGLVGSSGCSSWPHLHFEVHRASDGALVDPFLAGLWASPPAYERPLTILDSFVTNQEIVYPDTIANPPADAAATVRGGWLSVGINAAGGSVGDSLHLVITQPNGTIFAAPDINFEKPERHTLWYFQWTLGMDAPTGPWTVKISVNDTLNTSYTLQVN